MISMNLRADPTVSAQANASAPQSRVLPPAPVGIRSVVDGLEVRCYAFEEQRAIDQTRALAVWALPEIYRLELEIGSLKVTAATLTRGMTLEKARGDFYQSFAEWLEKEKRTDAQVNKALLIAPWALVVAQGIIMSALGGWVYSEAGK